MPDIKTGDRVAVKVTKNGDGNWQVVSAPSGFFNITSALFSDNEFIHGYVVFENGTDFEVYDTEGDETTSLLQILNITGTVIIQRPATPYASTNGGNRVTNDTGTHTLAIQLGAGTLTRFLRETNPSWKTFTSADATPDVANYRLFKTNGSTAITRFDSMEDGKVFHVMRGDADIEIQNNANVVLAGGANITLTTDNPIIGFVNDNGVARQFGLSAAPIGNIDALVFKGIIDASTNPNYPAGDAGHVYRISVAGKIGGASGVNVEVGDIVTCAVDGSVSGDQATVGANWVITQSNIDGAVIGPASSGDQNIPSFDGVTGKLLQDSGVPVSEVRTKSSGGTVAADGNNEITVSPNTRYTLTNGDTVQGVIGLADGQSAELLAPSSGSATLVDSGTVTSGQALALSGADEVITAGTESVWVITRVGSEIYLGAAGRSSGEIYPEDHGAVADVVDLSDGAMTSGSANLQSSSATFTSGDVGKRVVVYGAGAEYSSTGVGTQLITTISAFVDANNVTLAASAGTTVSSARFNYGTDRS